MLTSNPLVLEEKMRPFHHLHFDELESTQLYLKEKLHLLKEEGHEFILVTTNHQTGGVGRRSAPWKHFENSIAMSFSLPGTDPFSLTPLEVGVIVCHFFKKTMGLNLCLKWPNDILTPNGKKCGGIIIHHSPGYLPLVGLGVNFDLPENINPKDYNFRPSGIKDLSKKIEGWDPIQTAKTLYEFALKNRVPSNKIPREWSALCLHRDKEVKIIDGKKSWEGIFKGIGKNGEAIIQEEKRREPTPLYSGSLIFDL